jgi:hypothetical protein
MQVVGMLQKEISLDTDAIKAFQSEVSKATAGTGAGAKAEALARLAPQAAALRARNEALASHVLAIQPGGPRGGARGAARENALSRFRHRFAARLAQGTRAPGSAGRAR